MSYPVSVVTHQPGGLMAVGSLKAEVWTSKIFDCCEDMHTCCLGFWCPCCLACQVSSDLGESHCLPLLDMICVGTIPAVSLALRSTLRERYRIQGSIADDCCMVTCCSSCSWCQMARELKARANTTIQINTNSSQSPYNQS